MEQKSTTIFINPKFKNAYINPHFLMMTSTNNTIHVNPKFLNQQVSSVIQPPLPPPPAKVPEPPPIAKCAIIKNTKRSLIRAPEKIESTTSVVQLQHHPEQQHPIAIAKKMNLIKISNTKLVNASHLMTKQQKENETIKKATESLIKAKKLQRKKASGEKASIYKLDRTKGIEVVVKKKRKIINQFSIKNVDQPNTPSPKKKSAIVTNPKLLKMVNNVQQRDKKKYSLVLKKKVRSKRSQDKSKSSAQSSDARYFDKEANSSPAGVTKNIPNRSKSAPTLPDFIKI